MIKKSLKSVVAIAAATFSVWTCANPGAGDFPNKPVRLIVPVPAGQATDVASRLLADELTQLWGKQVVVENKVGGAAIPGMVAGKEALPDGYTYTLGTSAAMIMNRQLFKKLPYDVDQDYEMVHGFFKNPLIIVANAGSEYKSIRDFVAAAKKEPGKLNWSYPGLGNTQHMTGELFKTVAGIQVENVIYKGSAQAVTDLLANQISVGLDSIATVMPHIKSNKLRALAVTGNSRYPLLPDVPTLHELGFTNFDGQGFVGILAPKGTPAAILEKVGRDIGQIVHRKNFQEKFVDRGLIPYTATAKEWGDYYRAELKKWTDVAAKANIEKQ